MPPGILPRREGVRSAVIDIFGRWHVRSLRCYEEGLALRGIQAPVAPLLSVDPARGVLVEFLAAAVCHGTNWDRLRNHLLKAAGSPDHFVAERLANLTLATFVEEFGPAFGSVSDLAERHRVFCAVGAAFFRQDTRFDGKRLSSEPQRVGGAEGLYAQLDILDTFRSDPHRKKSRILVQQLIRDGLLDVSDPHELRPAIEYHLVRLYLRTGRVVHEVSSHIMEQSGRATDVRSVTALRAAVEHAMRYTADSAELNVLQTNDIEWQIARSFCDRSAPRCPGPPRQDKPVIPSIAAAAGGACIFAETCDGPRNANVAALVEPRLADHHAYY